MLANLLNTINYVHYEVWQEKGDPRIDSYPLLHGGPWKVLTIVGLYIFFAKYWGPKMMKNSAPWDCRRAMIIHNSVLIVLNLIGFLVGLAVTSFGAEAWSCKALDTSDVTLKTRLTLALGYLYFITKFMDFLDTLFFVLRKKNSHISGLHVFHHAIMPLTAWAGCKFFPGGNSALTPLVNSFVHAVMYGYYLLAALGIPQEKYIHLKKHITEIQLLQFTLVLSHSLYSLINTTCEWPRAMAIAEGAEAITFLKMFSDFYIHTYLTKKVKQK
ncbi:elongation of very long chain fatty acids protein AAEL008004-like [Panonychus citri]|uniref:elongation of very long chain fatty acids protein AAEL008004-like n=1 Tax=Panonychus citri TaxID=50023 RepID=UPI0023076347|nr:elongation of very long chain fatty acids protein AAEL008004-like [Panonychus citri]